MDAVFGEGLESSILACSMVILLPALAASLAAKEHRVHTAIAFFVGTASYTWLLWSGYGNSLDQVVSGFLFLSSAIALFLTHIYMELDRSRLRIAAGLIAGIAAGSIWIPCTGPQLAELTDRLDSFPFTAAPDHFVYLAGVFAPLAIVLSFIAALGDRWIKVQRPVAIGAIVILGATSVLTLLGRHTAIVEELVKVSSL